MFAENYGRRRVGLNELRTFLAEKLRINVSNATVSRYCSALELTVKKVKCRASGFRRDDQELCEMILDCVKTVRRECYITKNVSSIDFVYTGQRTRSVTSFVTKGISQIKGCGKISSYTNATSPACTRSELIVLLRCCLHAIWRSATRTTAPRRYGEVQSAVSAIGQGRH
jgi:hypothetical protein